MAVFRLQDSQNDNLQDGKGWFVTNPYSSSDINAITDPDGGKGSDPTSIPTPFARMDLVRTAYKFVNSQGLRGSTSYHKIVSHALDIGEFFFNYKSFGQKLNIFEWDKSNSVDKLIGSNDPNHKDFGKTLQMYLQQDAENFNFNQADKVYILLYKSIPIGGTSPVSLFFSTPNTLENLDIRLPNGNMAFKKITPLYERDKAFIRFLFSMRSAYNFFPSLFPEVDVYMAKCLQYLNQADIGLFDDLNQVDATQYGNNYHNIDSGIFVVNHLPLKQCDRDNEKWESDFTIHSKKLEHQLKPLVLKNGHSGLDSDGNPMIYYKGPYNPEIQIPYESDVPVNERELPGLVGVKYPFLTIGDFLEPYIIRTVFPIDNERFYDGSYKHPNSTTPVSYLLPLKTTFFEYFDIEDLEKPTANGDKMLKIEHRAGSAVKVSLKIPLAKGFVEYERTYREPVSEPGHSTPEVNKNEGIIAERRFDLAIFPFIRFEDNQGVPDYRICFVDGDQSALKINDSYDLKFYNTREKVREVPVTHFRERVKKQKARVGINNFVVNDNFNCINVNINNGDIKGLLIPRFKVATGGSDEYTFAIDLGTTYTHIEYSINQEVPRTLNIEKLDLQSVKLHDPTFGNLSAVFPEAISVFDFDFLPEEINKGTNYCFPIRTSILELKKLDIEQTSMALVERNIPFFYEKKTETTRWTKIITGLKWSTERGNQVRLEDYLANLLLILRNKVLVNQGNILSTKVIWFYPASMLKGRRFLFEKSWGELFEKYFHSKITHSLTSVSESLAPYFWYHNNEGAISYGDNTVISIDIGGETADVAVFKNNTPELITSFRFGADCLFDNGYTVNSPAYNGFIQYFDDKIKNKFLQNKKESFYSYYETLLKEFSSKDVISFLFSLENNRDLISDNVNISFSEMLSNSDSHRIVFVFYYASLIYHIAKLLKTSRLDMPRYITFSGTGSKVFNIINPNSSDKATSNTLDEYTKIIFEKVYNQQATDKRVAVLRRNDIPKEITAKGGFYSRSFEADPSKLKTVLVGNEEDDLAAEGSSYKKIKNDHTISSVVNELTNFIELFFSLQYNKEFDYEDNFLVKTSLMPQYQKILTEDLFDYVNKGLEQKLNELSSEDEELEETLFYYGIKGSMPKLIKWIADENK